MSVSARGYVAAWAMPLSSYRPATPPPRRLRRKGNREGDRAYRPPEYSPRLCHRRCRNPPPDYMPRGSVRPEGKGSGIPLSHCPPALRGAPSAPRDRCAAHKGRASMRLRSALSSPPLSAPRLCRDAGCCKVRPSRKKRERGTVPLQLLHYINRISS